MDCDDATPGDCSLRGAIRKANAASGPDQVDVPAGTYTLAIAGFGENAAATGDLDVTDDLTLVGAGAANTILQACTVDQKTAPCPAGQGIADDRVLHVDPNQAGITAEVAGVTIRHGAPDSTSFVIPPGGGILLGPHFFPSAPAGTLTLRRTVVRDNVVQFTATCCTTGGGIANNGGTLHLIESTVTGNHADDAGGGIDSNGTLTLVDSTVSDNTHNGGSGGGIAVTAGSASLTRSTVSGNRKTGTGFAAPGCGGGILMSGSDLTLTASTISGAVSGPLDPRQGLRHEEGRRYVRRSGEDLRRGEDEVGVPVPPATGWTDIQGTPVHPS